MLPHETVPIIQHAIQLAIAPVFLLTGIAALLGVMAGRLARINDRAYALEERCPASTGQTLAAAQVQMAGLARRRRLASRAINLFTGAALLLCIVIVTLFFEEFVRIDLQWLAGAQFVVVMVALIGGLASFMREVHVATHSLPIDADRFGLKNREVDTQ